MSPGASTSQELAALLKRHGPMGTAELAERLSISEQAVRQHLRRMEAADLVSSSRVREGVGRPQHKFSLTDHGEHLFPKRYDDLVVQLLDTIGGALGADALKEVLAAATEARVRQHRPQVEAAASLDDKLEALSNIYVDGDPWVEAGEHEGQPALIERNCPYLEVAQRRPALCSVTVHTLSRLLGRRVHRAARFQDGAGCCVFVVADEPVAPDAPFELE